MPNQSHKPGPPGRRGLGWGANLLAVAFVLLAVLVPFLFWQQTWFGTALRDGEVRKNLDPAAKPRKIQHALVQLSERLTNSGPGAVAVWYPAVGELVEHPIAEVRMTVAWLMGQDPSAAEFRPSLTRLLRDANPLVRRNAALSLVAFGEVSGRGEVRGMLASRRIAAPAAGELLFRLSEGDSVRAGTLLARIQVDAGTYQEVRAAVPGVVEERLAGEGTTVSVGQPLVSLAPEEDQVWEALRAMYFIGVMGDLALIQPFLAENPTLSERVRQQAGFTIGAIRGRAGRTKPACLQSRPHKARRDGFLIVSPSYDRPAGQGPDLSETNEKRQKKEKDL